MKILTLIPDSETYGVTVFVLLGLSSFQISSFLHPRCFPKLGLILSHVIIKAVVVLMGFALVPFHLGFGWHHVLSVPTGFLLGILSVHLEKMWMRRSNRFAQVEKRPLSTPIIQPKPLFGGTSEKKSFSKVRPVAAFDFQISWLGLMFLAILEELIFRGFLLSIFKGYVKHLPLQASLIILSAVVFGASHLLNGYAQVKSKTFFAMVTTFFALLLDSVVAPIIAHLYLNHVAYKLSRPAIASNS